MKKAIAAILTDTHMNEDTIELNKSIFAQAIQVAEQHGLFQLYHAGDFFHSRKAQTQDILVDGFNAILDGVDKSFCQLYAIPGNHDKTDYGSTRSFVEPFEHHPAFNLHKVSGWNDLNGVTIHMIPFFSDELYIKTVNDHIAKYLNSPYYKDNKHVLITHIGVSGAVMNNGIAVESKVTSNLFNFFDKVLIGHYHDPQMINDSIIYMGASIQHNFGETETKGLTMLYDDLSIETVELDFPRYIKLEVDVNAVTVKDINDIEQEVKTSKNKIRIVLKGTEADIKAFDKQRLKNVGADVKTKQDEIKAEDIETTTVAFNDITILDAFVRFCEKNELDEATGLNYLKQILV